MKKTTVLYRKRSAAGRLPAVLVFAALCLTLVFGRARMAQAAVSGFGNRAAGSSESEQERVFDAAGLFSAEEVSQLEQQIASFREASDMDFVVVTTNDAQGLGSERYADDYYDDGGFGTGKNKSGALFLINMDDREIYLSTAGTMIRYLTDSAVERALDDAYEYASRGDYAGAASAALDDAEYYYRKGIQSGQYNYDRETGAVSRYRTVHWYEVLISLAVAAFAAGSVVLGVKKQYAMKEDRQTAERLNMAYRAEARFACSARNDVMTNSFVNRQIIPVAVRRGPSSGRGRGGGGFSGGGRSTTHHSSGGRSHGGGGRRF